MNAAKFIVTAGLAIATGAAFAETGVSIYQIDNVTTVYGRASVPNVRIAGNVATQPGDVAVSGRDVIKGDAKIAVTAGKEVIEFGRS
jgi:hypothetical protein